jgi:hypothetical protein
MKQKIATGIDGFQRRQICRFFMMILFLALSLPGPGRSEGLLSVPENMAGRAKVTASTSAKGSGAGAAVDGKVGGYPDFPKNEWTSVREGAGAWLKLEWPAPVEINQIWIYDRVTPKDQIVKAIARFDDGRYVELQNPSNDGQIPAKAGFETVTTKTVQIEIIKVGGKNRNVGLAEVVVLKQPYDFSASPLRLGETPAQKGAAPIIVGAVNEKALDASLQPTDLTLNDNVNPTDVVDVAPVFKWKLPEGQQQSAWRIRLDTAAGLSGKNSFFSTADGSNLKRPLGNTGRRTMRAG